MPSASVYGNPYIHKEPPPKINYPGIFDGMFRLTFRYILDSKILALCTLLLGLAVIVVICMTITPFWFELQLNTKDGTFGTMPQKQDLKINSGLFYIDEDHFTNLVFLNKYSNKDVVPKVMAGAQVCSVFGTCILICCFAGALMLMLRRFSSATGTIFLAGGTSLSAVLHVMSILLCGILLGSSNCEPSEDCYKDNLEWSMIPIHSQMYRVEPHLTPYVTFSWAYIIAAIGAVLVIASAVLMWYEALMTVKNLTNIRYQQLREVRDPYAGDINPMEGKKYVYGYAPPQRYGPNSYGMQPVVHTRGPYPPPGVGVPPPHVGFMTEPTKGPYRPSSESGSSAMEGTREINL